MTDKTAAKRLKLEVAFDSVQMHQEAFWDAIGTLEEALAAYTEKDFVELDDNRDYNDLDLDTLLQEIETEDEEDEEDEEEECDCLDRSWYGPKHDTACPLAERPRKFIPGV